VGANKKGYTWEGSEAIKISISRQKKGRGGREKRRVKASTELEVVMGPYESI